MHDLFYKKGISYSEISIKNCIFCLCLLKKMKFTYLIIIIFIKIGNEIYNINLIEFILPLENIEIIQEINKNRNNLLNIDNKSLFKEYVNKNTALILIEDTLAKDKRVLIKILHSR